MQGFPYWGDGGGSPPPSKNLFIPPPPPPKVNLPLPKQQFSSYSPIKTTFLAVVIAPAPVIENNKKIILMIISII